MHRVSVERHGTASADGGLPLIRKAVVRGDTVYLCGLTPDPAGNVAAQTRQVLERVAHLLAVTGPHKSKLLTAQV